MIGRFLLGTGLGSLVGTGIVVMVAMLAPVKAPYAPVAGVGALGGDKAEEVPVIAPAEEPVVLPEPEVIAEAPALPAVPAEEPAPAVEVVAAPVAEVAPALPVVEPVAEVAVDLPDADALPVQTNPADLAAVEPAGVEIEEASPALEPAPATALIAAAQEPVGLVSPVVTEFALQAPVEATAGLRLAEAAPSQPLVPASETAPAQIAAPEAPSEPTQTPVAEATVAETPATTPAPEVQLAEAVPVVEQAPTPPVRRATDEFVILPEGIPPVAEAEPAPSEAAPPPTAEASSLQQEEPVNIAAVPVETTVEADPAEAEPSEAGVIVEASEPANTLPGQAAPAMPGATTAGTVRRIEPGGGSTLKAATSSVGLGGGNSRVLPRIGDEARSVVDGAPDARPLSAFARPFENEAAKPLFAVILIDDGKSDIDRAALAELPFPVSFAVDPLAPDASSRAEAYRAAGQEVLILASGLPKGAQASDVEVAFQAMEQTLPEAVAVMDLAERRFQADRPLASLVVPVIAAQGRGLVTWEGGGLNAANQVAQREAVPATVAFRNLDADAENEATIRRYLDRAAFKAAQEGRVTVVGHTRPETIAALLAWSIEGRGATVTLAPVSAVLAE